MTDFIVKILEWVRSYWNAPELQIVRFEPKRDLATYMVVPGNRTQMVFTVQVANTGKHVAERCVGILDVKLRSAPYTEGHYVLHWADTPYQLQTSGVDPVDIGPEGRRLDVLFTFDGQPMAGCWAASSSALSVPQISPREHLGPGDYDCTVTVHAPNAGKVTAAFTVTSATTWRELRVAPVAREDRASNERR